MLDITESTSRSQFIRGRKLLEDILIKRKIIQPAINSVEWLAILNS